MNQFDQNRAKNHLIQQEKMHQAENEKTRKLILERAIQVLREEFAGQNIEIFLIGSIVIPSKFNTQSDVDIVLKGFKGDRFEIWPILERKIGRHVEIILYEKCHFKDHIDQKGMRVV